MDKIVLRTLEWAGRQGILEIDCSVATLLWKTSFETEQTFVFGCRFSKVEEDLRRLHMENGLVLNRFWGDAPLVFRVFLRDPLVGHRPSVRIHYGIDFAGKTLPLLLEDIPARADQAFWPFIFPLNKILRNRGFCFEG